MNPQIEAARAAVASAPGDADARCALAQALERAGDAIGAIAELRAALRAVPAHAEAHHLLGLLLAGRGDTPGAIAAFEAATRHRPDHARAWNNLANALRAGGRVEAAERAAAEAVRLQPGYQLAWHNLGALRHELGRLDDAIAAYTTSAQLAPAFRPSQVALAAALRERGRHDEAIAAYRQAIALAPTGSLAERVRLADLLGECGIDDAARAAWAEAVAAHPDSLQAALGAHLTLPQVCADAAALDAARNGYEAGLAALERDLERDLGQAGGDSLLESWQWSNFFLAYQGRDDRPLQERYARLVARSIEARAPQWRAPLPVQPGARERRPRIGFVSAFFVDGTVGQYFRRWITGLDPARFEVFVVQVGGRADALTGEFARAAAGFVHATGEQAGVARLAHALRAAQLDAIVYPELGMDARCMALAALRLAPLQVAGWGHPVTTGHDTIDVFLTAGAMEPDGADAHYTERLVRLPGIGTSYSRPVAPEVVAAGRAAARADLRRRLGLPPDAPLFLCPQSLVKILPEDDALFARVLAAVPGSTLLVFEGRHRAVTGRFLQRLGGALSRVGLAPRERVRVLARMARADFLRANAACDAMLDTTRWSGGNTTLDALAAGLPVVAWPGPFMRARQSAAMLRQAAVPQLVATDADTYVRIAARLAQDGGWREHLSARILAGGGALFDDPAPLAAFAAFLREATARG